MNHPNNSTADAFEEVELKGHILDSLLLPKVLDEIVSKGGHYTLKKMEVGQKQEDPSVAHIEIHAPNRPRLSMILESIRHHGACPLANIDCQPVQADIPGCFPEGFYSTTNFHTQVRINGDWVEVQNQEMDCGIRVDIETCSANCIPMTEVQTGDWIVLGNEGVRVFAHKEREEKDTFEFMGSAVSSEKPKGVTVRAIAEAMRACRQKGMKILWVLGPAVVHTGGAEWVARMIRAGWMQVLFAGNALATHDIETALHGTSLGIDLASGRCVPHGHENHLRTINTIRRVGGIKQAVQSGMLKNGILFECVKKEVPFVLAGSIRDDGPLPEVITDVLTAQKAMREHLPETGFSLMIATTLHSIATGNLLPEWVKVACADINPSTVTKLLDRGSHQTMGVVTDAEPFLRELAGELGCG